jgi:hypothetical protein
MCPIAFFVPRTFYLILFSCPRLFLHHGLFSFFQPLQSKILLVVFATLHIQFHAHKKLKFLLSALKISSANCMTRSVCSIKSLRLGLPNMRSTFVACSCH